MEAPTNALLNLSRSSGLDSQRLLLLLSNRQTKHVVAEVLVDGRWIVVDPSFRTVMRDVSEKALTSKELQDPAKFQGGGPPCAELSSRLQL
ncbi:MAG TPA: hypothetical protein VMP12_00470 [Candidatus Sulfotelmatobacter sp.]|nr:hypothetical protein [Candidatus Sulfotelmatobacter sp.]